MQIIEKAVSFAALLAVIMGGVCPHEAIAQIHRATAGSSRVVSVPEYTSISVIDHSVEDRYMEYLQTLVDCDFQETTLANVADFIQHQTSVPLHFDERALNDAGVEKDATVSFRASQIPARSALKLILSRMDLTLLAKSNVILITTVEKANTELESRVYPVADLVSVQQDGVESLDFNSLIDLITTVIAPATWDEVGGPGSIQAFRSKSALVISQTADVHEAVAGLIEVLRRLPSPYSPEARSGIRRLPYAVPRWNLRNERETDQLPVLNAERMIGARDLGSGLSNSESAPSLFPPSSMPARASTVYSDVPQPNVAFPSWRTPRNHRD